VQRWRAGSRAWRRTVAPLLWTGALALVLLAVFNADRFLSRPVGAVPMWAFRLAFVAIPFAFLAVLLRVRLARASVAELVVELEEARPSGSLRDAMARALGDPWLTVAYWLPDQQRYVDLGGQPVVLPAAGQDRVATVVERDGRRGRGHRPRPGALRRSRAHPGPPVPRRRWRWTTNASRPSCAPGSTSSRRRGHGSWRPPTRSASGSSGTCTTAPSSG
jgi:hypothetical protein